MNRSDGLGDDKRSYNASVQYADKLIVCYENKIYQNNQTFLGAKEYVFPFEFKLPIKIATSFESWRGYIRYWVKGVIDVPWSIHPCIYAYFTVINKLNLNMMSRLWIPKGVICRKVFDFDLFKSKPVGISFDVQKSI